MLAEGTNTYPPSVCPKEGDSGLSGHTALKQTAHRAVPVTELPVANVELARSLLRGGTASSCVKERETDCKMRAAARQEQLNRLQAIKRQMQAGLQWLGTSTQQLNANIDSLKSDYKGLAEDIERYRRAGKHHRLVTHADQAALRLQALQEDGRLRALAHVGIFRHSIAPDKMPLGDRITILAQKWDRTCWEWLTEEQFMEITRYFGSQFMSFIEEDALTIMDMPHATEASTDMQHATGFRPAYTLSIYMPPAEKAYIMEAIDNLQPEAKREGGRRAYLAFMGRSPYIGSSAFWESELRRVDSALAALGCGDMQAFPARC